MGKSYKIRLLGCIDCSRSTEKVVLQTADGVVADE